MCQLQPLIGARRETVKTLARQRRGPRWWVIARTPDVLMDYLFELLLAVVCGISGFTWITGFSQSPITRILPGPVVCIFGSAFFLGSLTILVGLSINKYGTVVPAGLRLLAVACFAWAGLLMALFGLTAIVSICMASMLGALAGWRSFVLFSTYLLVRSADEHGAHTT